ncbi:MAG TPA: zinc ribbon domain-containing protein [Acidimicrobiales bacterium]|nr:zinc ribbon domain-containing protein [Acidimicrobiales bacterium]
MSAGTFSDPMSDEGHPTGRACEWCGSPMNHDGRAVCPSCGRLASRLAAMDEAAAPPEPPAPVVEAAAPPPPPAPPKPVPAPPAKPAGRKPPAPAPAAPSPHRPDPQADQAEARTAPEDSGPVAPGGRWPTPAPLPPEDEGRPWWKVAVPVVVVLVLVGAVAAFVLSGSGGGGGSEPTATKPSDKVDLSDIDDPKSTTTRPPTTTTEPVPVTTPDGRFVIESDSGITWTMAAEPDVQDVTTSGSSEPAGRDWMAVDGATTELVDLADLDALGGEFDPDEAMKAFAEEFDSTLTVIEDSHIEEAPGRTASFSGTVDGEPVVGYVVAAQVGDEGMVVAMFRANADLDDLYLDWLALPSSVQLP